MATTITDAANPAPATATAMPDAQKAGAIGAVLTHPLFHAAIVVAIVALGWTIASRWDRWTGAARLQRTDDAFIAGDTTPLATQISGYVRTVAVDDYQPVEAGQLIAEIEPADYQAQRDLAEADLAAARASLASVADKRAVQRTLIEQAKATITIAEAELVRANAEAVRQRELLRKALAGTEQLVEQADAAAAKAAGTLSLSRSQLAQQEVLLTSLDATERELAAQVDSARARLKLAQDNLGYTRIQAPVAGLTGARQVRPGQFVAPGTQIITVVPMATLWVVANLKETQMTNVRAGEPARVTVDAFPGTVLTGRVASWSPGTGSVFALLPPDNATGNFTKVVQRMPVKITLDPNPDLGVLIRPGMSVVATIDTGGEPQKQDGTSQGPRP
ncbi:HlyD family secretion protein (plasmid) [Bosea sp. F3-2]|uniref:HlyD family secretion protein n=1 Tax=Bosea sp. F3-2 TaxID=2599640 RepID=UPI0011F00131|nr:HlyD family secretion protein [Bosea sp. F3-2]QEL26956.1 HlyD family secretion protein [Bosea sp. F3-2]